MDGSVTCYGPCSSPTLCMCIHSVCYDCLVNGFVNRSGSHISPLISFALGAHTLKSSGVCIGNH